MNQQNNAFKPFSTKKYFVGISLNSSSSLESGIAILDRDLNLVRLDKVFDISNLESYIKNIAPIENLLVCIDLPKDSSSFGCKWRYGSRNINVFKNNSSEELKFSWIKRFSNRGIDLCKNLDSLNINVYRYCCYFTKNMLGLSPDNKSRTSLSCKALQVNIQQGLKISGIPSNLIAASGLDAMIGAYTAWRMANTQENTGYKFIGDFQNFPIVTAL